MIRRRALALTAACATAPWPTLALERPRVVLVGLDPLSPHDAPVMDAWGGAFGSAGYTDGANISLEYQYVDAAPAGRAQRLDALLTSLVRDRVDVLFSPRPEVVLAAKRATKAIPIVFAAVGNPVAAGLVDSLRHPGENATGISFDSSATFAGKQLQLLHDVVRDGRTFGVLRWDSPDGSEFITAARSAGKTLGLTLETVHIRDANELDAAFSRLGMRRVSGLLVIGSAYSFSNRMQIAALAIQHRLPTINAMREATLEGGLMSYGPVLAEQFRHAAAYIDRILKGTKPNQLPVQQPAKFELFINLKTAAAIGSTIPSATLVQADEVIR